jgi:hypothetical protein
MARTLEASRALSDHIGNNGSPQGGAGLRPGKGRRLGGGKGWKRHPNRGAGRAQAARSPARMVVQAASLIAGMQSMAMTSAAAGFLY